MGYPIADLIEDSTTGLSCAMTIRSTVPTSIVSAMVDAP